MAEIIPHWKFKNNKYIYTKDNSFKIIAYVVSGLIFLLFIFIIKSLVVSLTTPTETTETADLIGGFVISLLLLGIGFMLFVSANKNDKYIDLGNKTLNIKTRGKWKAITFSQIKSLYPIERIVNGKSGGIYYCFLLHNQIEPVRNQQDISDCFQNSETQNLFFNNMNKLLKIPSRD